MYPLGTGDYGRALWYQIWADTAGDRCAIFHACGCEDDGPGTDEAVIRNVIDKVQPAIFDYLEGEMGDNTYLVEIDFR